MEKIILTVKRPNGNIEEVDMMAKGWTSFNQQAFNQCKRNTAAAGRGEVLKAEWTYTRSNYAELERKYNRLMNEGGEGYCPDMRKHPEYKVWEETEVFC